MLHHAGSQAIKSHTAPRSRCGVSTWEYYSEIPIYRAVLTDTVGTGAVVLPDNACLVLIYSLLPWPARYRSVYRIVDGPLENETFSRSPTAIRRYCGINCLVAIVIFQQKITGPSGRPVPTVFNDGQFGKSEFGGQRERDRARRKKGTVASTAVPSFLKYKTMLSFFAGLWYHGRKESSRFGRKAFLCYKERMSYWVLRWWKRKIKSPHQRTLGNSKWVCFISFRMNWTKVTGKTLSNHHRHKVLPAFFRLDCRF